MGMWDIEAWDNDRAADWFASLMKESHFRELWSRGLEGDPQDDYEIIRAAIWLFAQLGRVYVWPIEHYQEDLERTLSVGEQLLSSRWHNEALPEYVAKLKQDLDTIRARRR